MYYSYDCVLVRFMNAPHTQVLLAGLIIGHA